MTFKIKKGVSSVRAMKKHLHVSIFCTMNLFYSVVIHVIDILLKISLWYQSNILWYLYRCAISIDLCLGLCFTWVLANSISNKDVVLMRASRRMYFHVSIGCLMQWSCVIEVLSWFKNVVQWVLWLTPKVDTLQFATIAAHCGINLLFQSRNLKKILKKSRILEKNAIICFLLFN